MEIHAPQNNTRDHPLMTSDFKGGGGFKMTPKNRTLGGRGVKIRRKSSDIIYERSPIYISLREIHFN